MTRSWQTTAGRTTVAVFDHRDDFYSSLNEVYTEHGLRQGYIPMFIAGFATADLVVSAAELWPGTKLQIGSRPTST
ncbi:hypothetical protein [Actinoplanes sp. NPDC020271]|uniref:hypothetical protein n=1 Tax=Actinoplanes sp. NPDC020271 TaxID=3363896 RepID=UPI003793706B